MNNLTIQSKTTQVNVSSNSYDNNSCTHISDLSKKEINFPNTGKDFGLTKESKTIQDEIPQKEIWKTHPDFPGYKFSSFGRAFSYKARPNRLIYGGEVSYGYIQLHLKDKNNKNQQPLLSRIVYELFGDDTDSLPKKEVDHIRNKEKTNNNINNLQLVERKENESNKGKCQANKFGNIPSSNYVGIHWHKKSQKWEASIEVKKKTFHLGYYKHPENGTYVYHEVAKNFKPSRHWRNNLPDNFQLPNEPEDRDAKIQEGINKINNWINQH